MGIWSPSTPGPSPAFAGTRSVRAFALWKVGFLGSLFRVQGTGFKGLLLYSLRFYVLKAGAFRIEASVSSTPVYTSSSSCSNLECSVHPRIPLLTPDLRPEVCMLGQVTCAPAFGSAETPRLNCGGIFGLGGPGWELLVEQ